MAGEDAEEPDDLYRLRIAAHECASALYEYIRFAITLIQAGEDPEFEQFKGKPVADHEFTGAEQFSNSDFDDPEIRFQVLIRSLVAFASKTMDKHKSLQEAFEPLEDELAAIYPGLQQISGATGRSHCKAPESFTFHVVRYTFDAIERFTPESEIERDLSPTDATAFTASNWYRSLKHVIDSFPEIDVEDHVHEAIEQEIAAGKQKGSGLFLKRVLTPYSLRLIGGGVGIADRLVAEKRPDPFSRLFSTRAAASPLISLISLGSAT